MKNKALRIGLTGGVASGKSTAAAMFASFGAEVIDADDIAKSLTSKGHPNIEKIVATFGSQYINQDGELDRKALRELIISDDKANHWLKALLHPQIFATMMKTSLNSSAPYCLLMVPLLAETSHDYQLNRICAVDCPEDLQLARLQQRDHVSAQQASDLARLQVFREQRLAIADDIILNDSNLPHLEAQVFKLHQFYLQLAKDHNSNN